MESVFLFYQAGQKSELDSVIFVQIGEKMNKNNHLMMTFDCIRDENQNISVHTVRVILFKRYP